MSERKPLTFREAVIQAGVRTVGMLRAECIDPATPQGVARVQREAARRLAQDLDRLKQKAESK